MPFTVTADVIITTIQKQDKSIATHLLKEVITPTGIIPKPPGQPDIFFADAPRSLQIPGGDFTDGTSKTVMEYQLVSLLGTDLAKKLILHYSQKILLFIDEILSNLILLQFQAGQREGRYLFSNSKEPTIGLIKFDKDKLCGPPRSPYFTASNTF